MSLNTGGFSRKSNPIITPTRTKNYVVPYNGSFKQGSCYSDTTNSEYLCS